MTSPPQPSSRPLSDQLPDLLIVVLAAGKGTRMQSDVPKVLHPIAHKPMLAHVLDLAKTANASRIAVVVGPDMDQVADAARRANPNVEIFVQTAQRGTADAVLAARPAIDAHSGDVIVLYADTPLIEAPTLAAIRTALNEEPGICVLGFHAKDPTGYGRLLIDAHGRLDAIREHREATEAERLIDLCNSGVLAFRIADLSALLDRIGNANAKQEFYLTDAVELARADGLTSRVVVCDEEEVLGVNARDQLADAEAIWQRRARRRVMQSGVTMVAPETVWLSSDTEIGRDCVIEPNVFFGPGVRVGAGAHLRANCHFEGASIGPGCRIGPFARLRPGAVLEAACHVGNFVEVKNVTMGRGAKANHLAYLGDGDVGAGANIGAGTIFCNYDGFFKHRTIVGEDAFVGSNSSLVAPVKIGKGAYVGSGSVITKDVSDGALALERNTQDERQGWAEKFRAMMARRKARG